MLKEQLDERPVGRLSRQREGGASKRTSVDICMLLDEHCGDFGTASKPPFHVRANEGICVRHELHGDLIKGNLLQGEEERGDPVSISKINGNAHTDKLERKRNIAGASCAVKVCFVITVGKRVYLDVKRSYAFVGAREEATESRQNTGLYGERLLVVLVADAHVQGDFAEGVTTESSSAKALECRVMYVRLVKANNWVLFEPLYELFW